MNIPLIHLVINTPYRFSYAQYSKICTLFPGGILERLLLVRRIHPMFVEERGND